VKSPTDEKSTHEPDDAPAEPFMRKSEALVQTSGSPELDLVRQHLVAIEAALRRRNGEGIGRSPYGDDVLERVVQLEKQRRGLDTQHKRIRYAFKIVAQLIKWGDVSKGAARYLRVRLAAIDALGHLMKRSRDIGLFRGLKAIQMLQQDMQMRGRRFGRNICMNILIESDNADRIALL